MNVSPLDLRQQRFGTVMRGFDKVEVTSFLMAVADDYEQALRETDRLRTDLARLEGIVSQHRENEKNLQNFVDLEQLFATNIPGSQVFGGISGEVRGSVDLDPQLTADTLLSTINGGEGLGPNAAIAVSELDSWMGPILTKRIEEVEMADALETRSPTA